MAKFSIYVPDELWERAMREMDTKKNPSQLVQDVLQRFVSEREARATALVRSVGIERGRVESVVAKLRAAAQAEFGRGYEAALELIEREGFNLVETLVTQDVDIYEAPDWLAEDDEWLRRYQEFADPANEHPVFLDGANRAVRDVWDALRREGWGADATAEDGDDSSGPTSPEPSGPGPGEGT